MLSSCKSSCQSFLECIRSNPRVIPTRMSVTSLLLRLIASSSTISLNGRASAMNSNTKQNTSTSVPRINTVVVIGRWKVAMFL